ncbi:MAG TPA: metalloregulator ArsR/SmtB family transcription factor [Longimicrobiales bacterium]
MATTTTHDKALLAVFHALSDQTRLSIVRRLAGGERCVCDLQDLLDAAQSRLSYHLRTLKEAGLITDRREGRWVHYSLVPGALESVVSFMGEMEAAAQECHASGRCC